MEMEILLNSNNLNLLEEHEKELLIRFILKEKNHDYVGCITTLEEAKALIDKACKNKSHARLMEINIINKYKKVICSKNQERIDFYERLTDVMEKIMFR